MIVLNSNLVIVVVVAVAVAAAILAAAIVLLLANFISYIMKPACYLRSELKEIN